MLNQIMYPQAKIGNKFQNQTGRYPNEETKKIIIQKRI